MEASLSWCIIIFILLPKPETWASSSMSHISSPSIPRLLIISAPFMASLSPIPKVQWFHRFMPSLLWRAPPVLNYPFSTPLCILHQETSGLSELQSLPCLHTFQWVPLFTKKRIPKFLKREHLSPWMMESCSPAFSLITSLLKLYL